MSAVWKPPDGGYGWVIVAASFVITFIISQPICTFGLYLPVLVDYFSSSPSVLSWVGSLLLSSGNFAGVVIGVNVELFGSQKISLVGGAILVLSCFLSAIFKSVITLFIFYGFMLGLSLNMLFNGTTVSIHSYFSKKRAFASSISTAALSLGSLLWAPLTQYLINQYNWYGAMLIFSGIYLNVIPLAWLLKETPPAKEKYKNNKDIGFIRLIKRSLDFSLLRNLSFVLYIVSAMFVSFTHMIPYIYLPLHSIKRGYSSQMSSFLLSYIGVTGLIFRVVFGYIGDNKYVNRTVLFSLAATGAGIIITLMMFSNQYYQFAVLGVLFSVFASGYMAVASAILVDILGITKIARSLGFYYMACGFAFSLSLSSAGMMIDVLGDTAKVFLVAGCVAILAGIFAMCSFIRQKTKTRKQELAKKVDELQFTEIKRDISELKETVI